MAALPKIIKKDVHEASQEARAIIEAAHAEAREIVKRAEHDRESVLESGWQSGYQEGLKQWNEAVFEAKAAREAQEKLWEETLLKLSTNIAAKIIGEELRVERETIVSIVREALKSAAQERDLTIQVNPQHLETVQSHLDRLQKTVGISRRLHVMPNLDLSLGSCIVESELGVIDARLETQLRCLEEVLIAASKKQNAR